MELNDYNFKGIICAKNKVRKDCCKTAMFVNKPSLTQLYNFEVNIVGFCGT